MRSFPIEEPGSPVPALYATLVGIPVKLLSIEIKFRENEISENQAYLEFRAGSES